MLQRCACSAAAAAAVVGGRWCHGMCARCCCHRCCCCCCVQGLGLSLCKEFIETGHGGRVEVDSDVGRGSEFAFVIPFPARPSGGALEAAPAAPWVVRGTDMRIASDGAERSPVIITDSIMRLSSSGGGGGGGGGGGTSAAVFGGAGGGVASRVATAAPSAAATAVAAGDADVLIVEDSQVSVAQVVVGWYPLDCVCVCGPLSNLTVTL
jgi:hypothetical protein